MSNLEKLEKNKKVLRCQTQKIGDTEVSRISTQARVFIDMHKKNELERVLSAFKTEALADVLDFLVLEDAMLEKNRRYRDYKADLVEFIAEIKKLSK